MKEAALSECLAILRAMPHGREQEWTDALRPLYVMALRPMQDDEAKNACAWAALNEDWRPSPAALRKIAARLAAPYPDDNTCYAELIEKTHLQGLYGTPVAGHPNCYVEGPPPMSHPIVSQVVAYCGGWEMICSGEANLQEGLRKQVRSAHDSCARQWESEVAQQLGLPPGQRDQRYFHSYPKYVAKLDAPLLESATEEVTRQEPLQLASDAPDGIREAVEGLADALSFPDAERARKRAAIERLRREVKA